MEALGNTPDKSAEHLFLTHREGQIATASRLDLLLPVYLCMHMHFYVNSGNIKNIH